MSEVVTERFEIQRLGHDGTWVDERTGGDLSEQEARETIARWEAHIAEHGNEAETFRVVRVTTTVRTEVCA